MIIKSEELAEAERWEARAEQAADDAERYDDLCNVTLADQARLTAEECRYQAEVHRSRARRAEA